MASNKIKAFFFMVIMTALCAALFADKTSVRIIAPDKVLKGTEATITLEVSHHGNNIFHYTDWVYLKVNGAENKKWEFGGFSRPESENFKRTVTLKVDQKIELEAEGNCNIHGSMGTAKTSIDVQ